MGLVRVVGYVPARSFELHGGRGNHLLNPAAALRTLLNHLVGEFLDFLEAVTALFTLIFVKWHEMRDSCEEIYSHSDSRVTGQSRQFTRRRGGGSI